MLLYWNRTLFVEIKKLGFMVRISCHVAAVPGGGTCPAVVRCTIAVTPAGRQSFKS